MDVQVVFGAFGTLGDRFVCNLRRKAMGLEMLRAYWLYCLYRNADLSKNTIGPCVSVYLVAVVQNLVFVHFFCAVFVLTFPACLVKTK